jgi:hypothetical protein
LGISKPALAMAERGLRNLPAQAGFKLTRMELERLQKETAPAMPCTSNEIAITPLTDA